MTITINKDSFPRFTKRLKKSLQKKSIDLSHSEIQDIAAQSLGKENYYELNALFSHEKTDNLLLTEEFLPVTHKKSQEKKTFSFIEDDKQRELAYLILEIEVHKALEKHISKTPQITLNLQEVSNLINCYEGDEEVEMTISRFKNDNKQLYAWFTEYPEEGYIPLGDEINTVLSEENEHDVFVRELENIFNDILEDEEEDNRGVDTVKK